MNVFAIAVVAANLAAAACAIVFVAMYARRRWYTSRTGRNLMGMSATVALAAILAGISWAVVAVGSHEWFTWLAPLAAVVWMLIAGGFLARIADLKRAEKDKGNRG